MFTAFREWVHNEGRVSAHPFVPGTVHGILRARKNLVVVSSRGTYVDCDAMSVLACDWDRRVKFCVMTDCAVTYSVRGYSMLINGYAITPADNCQLCNWDIIAETEEGRVVIDSRKDDQSLVPGGDTVFFGLKNAVLCKTVTIKQTDSADTMTFMRFDVFGWSIAAE